MAISSHVTSLLLAAAQGTWGHPSSGPPGFRLPRGSATRAFPSTTAWPGGRVSCRDVAWKEAAGTGTGNGASTSTLFPHFLLFLFAAPLALRGVSHFPLLLSLPTPSPSGPPCRSALASVGVPDRQAGTVRWAQRRGQLKHSLWLLLTPFIPFFLCEERKLGREHGGQPSVTGPGVCSTSPVERVDLHALPSTAHPDELDGLPGRQREACGDRATSLQVAGETHGRCPTSVPFCQFPERMHNTQPSPSGKIAYPTIRPFWLVLASCLPDSKLLALPPQPWPFGLGGSIQSSWHLALGLPGWALSGSYGGTPRFCTAVIGAGLRPCQPRMSTPEAPGLCPGEANLDNPGEGLRGTCRGTERESLWLQGGSCHGACSQDLPSAIRLQRLESVDGPPTPLYCNPSFYSSARPPGCGL